MVLAPVVHVVVHHNEPWALYCPLVSRQVPAACCEALPLWVLCDPPPAPAQQQRLEGGERVPPALLRAVSVG